MILKGTFPTEKFKSLATPFYFYDITLLKETLNTVKTEAGKYGYHVHYAVKANANPRILSIIAEYGLGASKVLIPGYGWEEVSIFSLPNLPRLQQRWLWRVI
mgnify:CR=1 FL=1